MLLFLVMNKKNKGFTLTETLMTITILVILFALAVPCVFTLKKNLRQMELDDKAEIIYTAMQNRLSELYTSGLSGYYDPSNPEFDGYFKVLNDIPKDFEANDKIGENDTIDFYYFTSENADELNQLLGANTIDETLKNGHYVIEYMPYAVRDKSETQKLTVPFVYAVYYSEEPFDVSKDYESNNSKYINNYRIKMNRLKEGANLGYYGGSTPGSGSVTNTLSITSVKIYSDEEINYAVAKARIGVGIDDKTVTFKFEFKDDHGNVTTYFYKPVTNTFYNDKNVEIVSDCVKRSVIGSNYTFTFTMDDLSSDNTRFKNLFPQLNPGDDITLVVTAESSDNTVFASQRKGLGNSIYSYVENKSEYSEGHYDTNTAYIKNARHLQNLDESSEVNRLLTNKEFKAFLIDDIDFSNDSEFFSKYYSSYFNKKITINKINNLGGVYTVTVPCFRGITNKNLFDLNGNKHVVKELSSISGLFDVVNADLIISKLRLTGERVYGKEYAGGLISNIQSGNVSIKGCVVYLDNNFDIPTSIKPESYLESIRWIYAKTSGGLVGYNNGALNITNSFVATNIGSSTKDAVTGGLVGKNVANLTIKSAYADCYLYGNTVGGLVGDGKGNITIDSAYSAGFIGTDGSNNASLAGLVFGDVDHITNSYTIMREALLDNNRSVVSGQYGINTQNSLINEATYYATVKSVKDNNYSSLYYERGSSNSAYNCGSVYTKELNLGSDFDLAGASHPYTLMGTSLTSYPNHKLKGIDHFGDWAAEFETGSLVYFEKYINADGTFEYGFEGANVDISLTAEKPIVGDGYGVVFKSNTLPSDNQFIVNGVSYNTNTVTSYSVIKNGVEYKIYPLNKDELNPNSAVIDFYKECSISVTGDTKKFFYNPHFGRSVVESDSKPTKISDNKVYIRSPRHLNNLSLYFDEYTKMAILGNKISYWQERNMDYVLYDWYDFANKANVTEQMPIGKDSINSFNATYNGGCFEINNVNFVTKDGTYVGLFGYNDGTIKDVVVATQYAKNGNSYNVRRTDAVGENQEAYFGVLVGYNNGKIDNCAIAGYYLDGDNGKIHGYRNSKIYIGGLVGFNSSKGIISNCAADLPKLSLVMNNSTCYAASFVGYNEGVISNAYGISLIDSNAQTGDTKIAGFAGFNTGSINNTYCATALVSSGNGSSTYSFAPIDGGGYVYNSYYLSGSSFQYIDDLYSYDGEVSKTSGSAMIYNELVNFADGNNAKTSLYHQLTTDLDSNEKKYPYKAIIKNGSGDLVHYGEWQVKPELGVVGVFYWEHETSGQNNGYKITYVGSSNGKIKINSNLCEEHNDGGIISEFGYGYYVGKGEKLDDIDFDYLEYSNDFNNDVKKVLERQIPYMEFFPFTTSTDTSKDYIYLNSDGEPNGTIKLTQGSNTYNFSISPFFANALSYNTGNDADTQKYVNQNLGLDENSSYKIRSANQLQYINWNYKSKNNTELSSNTNDTNDNNYRGNFTYLMYSDTRFNNGSVQATQSPYLNSTANKNKYFYFVQTHDINAKNIKKGEFVPIAGQTKSNISDNSYQAYLATWFGGSFDGQSYKIQELSISSNCFTVGLFGTTCGANLKNIILYSSDNDDRAVIERNAEYGSDTKGAYALGGLVGVAYDYNDSTGNSISNCSIAGYRIIDNSKNQQNLGEANVGGLVGISKINIAKCSSVVDIEINCTHGTQLDNGIINAFHKAPYGNYIRVGGISGAGLGKISYSYTGGTINVGEKTLNENVNGNRYYNVNYINNVVVSKNDSTNVYLSGITGSGFCMNFANITNEPNELQSGNPTVENCYTYITFPKMEGTIRNITMFASIADRYANNPRTYVNINNCYYLDRSENFEFNLPKFIVRDGGSQNKTVASIMNLALKQAMIDGKIDWMYAMHKDSSLGWNFDSRATITDVSTKNYDELSDSKIINTLNKNSSIKIFDFVTKLDKKNQPIDGKYSFSTGNNSLEGKNYPFPTVIRQEEDNFTYNVHYGAWPFISAYFKNGSDSIDILIIWIFLRITHIVNLN